MKWRRQPPGLHLSSASLWIEKEEPIEEGYFARGTDAPVEIFQIGAASQSHMLAIVHMLAVGQHVGGCPAAEEGTLFKQTYAPAGFSQRDAGCQSRQAAADHDHAFKDILFRVSAEARLGDEHHFLRLGKPHALTEDGKVHRLDATEQRAVSMDEQPQCAAAIGIDETKQCRTLFIKLPGAFGFEAEQFANAESRFGATKIFR